MQLTINSFRQLFPDKFFFPDISQIFSKFPDISLTAVKFSDISRFSRQVVTLYTGSKGLHPTWHISFDVNSHIHLIVLISVISIFHDSSNTYNGWIPLGSLAANTIKFLMCPTFQFARKSGALRWCQKQLRVAKFKQFSFKPVLRCEKRISWTGVDTNRVADCRSGCTKCSRWKRYSGWLLL